MSRIIVLCQELVYLHEGPAISVVMKPNCLSYSWTQPIVFIYSV